jgi:endonuclease III
VAVSRGKLIKDFGQLYSEMLGIDLRSGRSEEIFKWFLASVLFGAPIRESSAIKTYNILSSEGITSPDAILDAGWDRLVLYLDNGGYTRYDFKTADKLLELARNLKERWGGDINRIYATSKSQSELESNLRALARGIGETTLNIFLREMYGVWKVKPKHSGYALLAAKRLGISLPRAFNPRLEVALMRLGREMAKKLKS